MMIIGYTPRHHYIKITAKSAVQESALAKCGIIQGQVIRRLKTIAAEYARRLPRTGEPSLSQSSPVG
jgi:hypothetical protein